MTRRIASTGVSWHAGPRRWHGPSGCSDHSRAFVSKKNLQTKVERVDEKLWAAIQALTPEALRETLGPLVGDDAVNAMLERRTRIQAEVDKLLAKKSPRPRHHRGGPVERSLIRQDDAAARLCSPANADDGGRPIGVSRCRVAARCGLAPVVTLPKSAYATTCPGVHASPVTSSA